MRTHNHIKIRYIMLNHFEKGWSAAESFRELTETYGEGTIAQRTVQKWFARFKAGDTDVEDKKGRGRTSEFDDNALLETIEEYGSRTTRMLAEEFGVDQKTIANHLHKIGKVWKIGGWFPHQIIEENKEERFSVFSELAERNEETPFGSLRSLITGDEKCIHYKNPKRQHYWVKRRETPTKSTEELPICDQNNAGPSETSEKRTAKDQSTSTREVRQNITGTSDANTHMQTHAGEKPFKCTYGSCSKGFATNGNLKTHMRIHYDEKPFKCTFNGCAREFTQECNLKAHMGKHNGEKPFKCTFNNCTRKFTRNENLEAHIRKHNGEAPFKCTFQNCTSEFPTNRQLKAHMWKHNDEKPFKCTFDDCSKGFSTNYWLKVHMRDHTGETPFKCTVDDCFKEFTRNENLKAHMQNHTGKKQ